MLCGLWRRVPQEFGVAVRDDILIRAKALSAARTQASHGLQRCLKVTALQSDGTRAGQDDARHDTNDLLGTIASGLGRLEEGQRRLDLLGTIASGLGRLEEGQRRLEQGQRRLEQGLRRLEQGLRRLEQGQRRLEQGQRRLEQGQGQQGNVQGLLVALILPAYLERRLGERFGRRAVLTNARSLMAALLSEADPGEAVAALVDWLIEEHRGFLAVLAAEMQVQIDLLMRDDLEQAEGQLAERLVSARSELVKRLPVPWARAESGAGSEARQASPPPSGTAGQGAAAPLPLMPDLATEALRLIKKVREVRDANRPRSSSSNSKDGKALVGPQREQQQGFGPASGQGSLPSATGAKVPGGAVVGLLEAYLKGSPAECRGLLEDRLCMPALSSLQPTAAAAVGGSHSGGASGGGARSCPSPAVSELEVDNLSLMTYNNWADLTLVETKTSSKGTSTSIPQLARSATVLLCTYHVLRERSAACRAHLPPDLKARGVVVWAAVKSDPTTGPVTLHPACGPDVVLDVDVLSAKSML